ncbi:MAG: hypothetical protein WAQ27_02285 [Candidatus Microsaccharimonas sp.]
MALKHKGAALALALILALSGCANGAPGITVGTDDSSSPAAVDKNDPQEDWVIIAEGSRDNSYRGLAKRCDNTTLLYASTGWETGNIASLQAVVDSEECEGFTSPAPTTGNTDLHKDWVIITEGDRDNSYRGLAKRCDGKTLIYASTGWKTGNIDAMAIITDSPECVR